MRETLTVIGQTALVTSVAFTLLVGLAFIVIVSEDGRGVMLNIFTGLAIWWLITALQEWREQGRTCALCRRIDRTRCPVCNTPH